MNINKLIAKLDDLKPDRKNANRGTERGRYMVETSLERYGAGRSIVVDRDGNVIAGNKTLEAALEKGFGIKLVETHGDELVVVRRRDLDIDDEKGRGLAYMDNRASEVGLEWDLEQIASDRANGIDLSPAWHEDELDNLLADLGAAGDGAAGEAPEPEVDRAEELREKWQAERGQLWQIGRHRLLCGDATSADDVGRLMGDELAEVLWTDPPYGVSYVGKTRDALVIENDGAEGLPALLRDALSAVDTVMAASARFYAAAPPGPRGTDFRIAIKEKGWKLHQCLVWVKSSMVLGHSDYHYRHEDVLYGYKPGPGRAGRGDHEGSRWYGDHAQTTVLEFDKPARNTEHPTMKPVPLINHCLANSARRGDVVLDIFNGSGSTLAACEGRGLQGRGCEIDPRYVAVTLERLAAMGLSPELVEHIEHPHA